jgi:hypothetical protein
LNAYSHFACIFSATHTIIGLRRLVVNARRKGKSIASL